MNSKFLVFPWQQPFLPSLKAHIEAETSGNPGRALLIVPNQRPWRYLQDLYSREKKAGAIPKLLPFDQIATIWARQAMGPAYCAASQLDSVQLLRECIAELAESDKELSARFVDMSMATFLPWGIRLARLLDEIFAQGISPRDLSPTEGEAPQLAEAILGALGRIGELYRKKLETAKPRMMTSGLASFYASQNAANIPSQFMPGEARPIFIAGFSILNGTEDKLFHSLWQAGAQICLHGDPALVNGEKTHHAATGQLEWIKRWHAQAELAYQPITNEPEYSFYAAYDEHSQIGGMIQDLQEANSDSETTAIILPEAGMLMPVLHHLPDKEINISMGYPLARAQLRSFFDDIFQLQLQRSPDGGYYWRNLLRLFHQPYLDILAGDPDQMARLNHAIQKLDQVIRLKGFKYINLEEVKKDCSEPDKSGELLPDAEQTLLFETMDLLVNAPARMATTFDIATTFGEICNFLIKRGEARWKRFPLDSEALSRIQNKVLPVLADNLLCEEAFPMQVLHDLFMTMLDAERIPFEADPLVGAQILGLLETRLLQFDNLYIMNASDELLPGVSEQDPLLPDSLRMMAGLPDSRQRKKVVDYNLFSLLFCSKKVHFYWSEGSALSKLAAGKRSRSRYVDQILWQIEQRKGKLAEVGDGLLNSASASAKLNPGKAKAIERGKGLDAVIQKMLMRPISPSAINDYLGCPAKFAMKRLLRIKEPDEIGGGSHLLVGNCIHAALADLLGPYQNQKIRLCDVPEEQIEQNFIAVLEKFAVHKMLSVEEYLMFERAGLKRLKKYLSGQEEEIIIKAIESQFDTELIHGKHKWKLTGKIDRLDQREKGLVIVDYKTGDLHKPKRGIWAEKDFFEALRSRSQEPFDSDTDNLLVQLRDQLPDIQLPAYLLMQAGMSGRQAEEAVWIDLKDTCKEMPLIPEPVGGELEASSIALKFILWHLANTTTFNPSGHNCERCEFKASCGA